MKIDSIDKRYNEHRGTLIKKYRNILGRYVFIIGENEKNSKVYVGKGIFKKTEVGSKLTIGEINRKLINIRPGICKNNDK